METTNATTDWTQMFNASVTRTTKYGYSNTCTLVNAIMNRRYMDCANLASNFAILRMAIGMMAARKSKRAAK